MTALDRALAALDAGLQSSPERGSGTDTFPDRCARCQTAEPGDGGDLCAGCRAFLLGDADTDPSVREVPWPGPLTREWARQYRMARETYGLDLPPRPAAEVAETVSFAGAPHRVDRVSPSVRAAMAEAAPSRIEPPTRCGATLTLRGGGETAGCGLITGHPGPHLVDYTAPEARRLVGRIDEAADLPDLGVVRSWPADEPAPTPSTGPPGVARCGAEWPGTSRLTCWRPPGHSGPHDALPSVTLR